MESVGEGSVEQVHEGFLLLGRNGEFQSPGHHALSEPVRVFLLKLSVTYAEEKLHRVKRIGEWNLKRSKLDLIRPCR